MKYSKTALMELSHKYAKILKKCAYLNAIAIMGILVASSANAGSQYIPESGDWGKQNIIGNVDANAFGAVFIKKDGVKVGENSNFENNKSYMGGAITIAKKIGGIEIGSGTTFKNNTAVYDGGAIGNYGSAILGSNVSFIGNKSNLNVDGSRTLSDENPIGGGAISLGVDATLNLSHATFRGNESGHDGGAIATRRTLETDEITGFDSIDHFFKIGEGSVFSQNKALGYTVDTGRGNSTGGNGGAIANTFKSVEITGTVFTENEAAQNGGAIYNTRFIEKNTSSYSLTDKGGDMTIKDTSFTNNKAQNLGGAIYNNGTLTLAGTNTFSGNMANGALNDIHNVGTVNVSGDLNLEGGITGNGVINFKATNLTARLLSSAASINADTITGLDKVSIKNLIVENNLSDGTYKLLSTGDADFANIGVNNALYTFTQGENAGEIKVSKKSSTEIVDNLTKQGVDNQVAGALTALTDSEANAPVLNKINEALQTGNTSVAAKVAQDLAPTTSQEIMGIAQGVNHILSNVANNRMAAIGRSSGDAFVGGALWAQGLYNYTKQDKSVSTDGFKAHMSGLSFGVDGKVNDNLTVGIGYGYTDTDADAGARDIDIKGHNIFAYSEYQQGNWYVNGMLNYGFSKYTEKKAPAGVALKAKYDVHTYAANMMTGYHFDNGFTPEVGLRYLFADQDAYNDGVQRIKTDNNDVLTGVAAIKYHQAYQAKDWTFKPNLRLGATYDMMSDNGQSVVSVIGGSSYQINSKRLNRFGVETGVGVEAIVGDWNLSLDYNGGFRADFQSHTGMLKAKYNF